MTTTRRPRRRTPESSAFPTRHYDLVKEFVIATVVVSLLTVLLAAVFSSPDQKSLTVKEWSRSNPADFVATALAELDGTSGVATYGPPYNSGDGQKIGPLDLAKAAGVRYPIDTADAFVITPLQSVPANAALSAALQQYTGATADQQQRWTSAYSDALAKAPGGDPAKVASGDYGPVPVLMNQLLSVAQSGTLDGLLVSEQSYFQTDYTLPLLFIADGSYLSDKAEAENLGGEQWGMMNEAGSYPGQAWLWLYTMWYQVKPFSTSDNADALVWALMMLLSLVLVLVPFIPGLRDIPRLVPVYKLIWRDYYRSRRE